MILTLDNLVKSLIGKLAKADHPLTVANPEEYFIITQAKIDDGKIVVRGENTVWFGGGMVELCEDDEEIRFEPIRDANGSLKQFMPKVNGKPFYCECGCNVFHNHDQNRPFIYECNACGQWYESKE